MTHDKLRAAIGEICYCGGKITYIIEGDALIPVCSNGCDTNDIVTKVFAELPTKGEIMSSLVGEIFTTRLLYDVLDVHGISIRRNEISGEVELSGIPESWSQENAENNLPVLLLDVLRSVRVKGANKNAICDALDVISDENRYNPVKGLLQSTRWDEVDRLPIIYEILGLKDTFAMQLVWKWLQQSVAMAFNSAVNPYGADGVLVLQGLQGIGKTTFFKRITPIPSLFKEGADIDPQNKDTIIQATSYWITELGELERATRREQASLKAFLTAAVDQFRTPYARNAVKRPRRTSFCGTVNPGEFLVDDTGNRRFWTVPVEKIDLDRLFNLSDEWILQLWIQAYDEWRESPQGFRLSGSDRAWLDKVNRNFEKPLRCELEVKSLFYNSLPRDQWIYYTPAEIAKKIMPTPPAECVGRVLSKLAREDERIEKKRTKHGWIYELPIRDVC